MHLPISIHPPALQAAPSSTWVTPGPAGPALKAPEYEAHAKPWITRSVRSLWLKGEVGLIQMLCPPSEPQKPILPLVIHTKPHSNILCDRWGNLPPHRSSLEMAL